MTRGRRRPWGGRRAYSRVDRPRATSLQRSRTCERYHFVKLLLTERREEEVVGGDSLSLHGLDRVYRVDEHCGQEHREGGFRNSAHAEGHADEHPRVRVRNHADLWTVEDQIQRGGSHNGGPQEGR